MKIELQYVKEAKRIVENYNSIIDELAVFEKTLADNKNMLLSLQKDIDNLSDLKGTELLKKSKLFEVLTEYDKKILKLQEVMLPYISKLEVLKKDSNILYGILKEKYPGATDKQLQEHLFKEIEKIKGAF